MMVCGDFEVKDARWLYLVFRSSPVIRAVIYNGTKKVVDTQNLIMDYLQKIIEDIETHSVEGIKECFAHGIDPNDALQGTSHLFMN